MDTKAPSALPIDPLNQRYERQHAHATNSLRKRRQCAATFGPALAVAGGRESTAQSGEERQGGNLPWNDAMNNVDAFETLSLTELIQKLTDDINRQERELKELESRCRVSMISAGAALGLCLISSAIGSTATYVNLLWLALAAGSALVAFLAHKRRALIIDLIGHNRWFRSIVIEEAYTGKDIGPQI